VSEIVAVIRPLLLREVRDPAKVRDRPGGLGFVSAPWSARVRVDDGEIGRA